MEGTHSSVPARQPANMIWRQWVLSYTAVICVCVCVCVCVGEIVRKKLIEWDWDGEREWAREKKKKNMREMDGWMDGDSGVVSVVSEWANWLSWCRLVYHTHTQKHTAELYYPLGCWSDGSVSYLVIGSEQQFLSNKSVLYTNKLL